MPSIQLVTWNDHSNSADVELPKEGLIVDSRAIVGTYGDNGWRFECTIEGKTLTVTRTDEDADDEFLGWEEDLYFRLYDPTVEEVPEFNNETYTYHGLENEQAPFHVEEVIVDPSVKIIRKYAFNYCKKMKKCTMGDNVERIEEGSFCRCESIKNLRLSRALQFIGKSAFLGCDSIECLFIPPNVGKIEGSAFLYCVEMKILILPDNIDLDQIGPRIIFHCPGLLTDQTFQYSRESFESDRQIHTWLKHRYNHLPLIRLCADPDVTATTIQQFIQDHGTAAFHQNNDDHNLITTPLHILTRYNGFARDDTIIACFGANPAALFIRDREGLTPLDNLWNESRLDVMVDVMQDLCMNHRLVKNHEDAVIGNDCKKRKIHVEHSDDDGLARTAMLGKISFLRINSDEEGKKIELV